LKKSPLILVVDDDPDDRYFLSEALHEVDPNSSIKQVMDGQEALHFLEHECSGKHPTSDKPDIILLDLNMARIDGRAATNMIKSNKELSHIPIVIITTSQNEDERGYLLKLGADAFYTKPMTVDELAKIVQEIYNKFLVA
jgi:CheY-like chemotaxis protein